MALINSHELNQRKSAYTLGYINPDWPDEVKAEEARLWRDKELSDSDWVASIPDHGMHTSYMAYRTALRDWPSTSDFPDTKPTL